MQLETLDPLYDVPILCELGDARVILFLLFFNGLPSNIKIFQCLSHHGVSGELAPDLFVVARLLRGNHDVLLALSQDHMHRLRDQLVRLYLSRRVPE